MAKRHQSNTTPALFSQPGFGNYLQRFRFRSHYWLLKASYILSKNVNICGGCPTNYFSFPHSARIMLHQADSGTFSCITVGSSARRTENSRSLWLHGLPRSGREACVQNDCPIFIPHFSLPAGLLQKYGQFFVVQKSGVRKHDIYIDCCLCCQEIANDKGKTSHI